MQFKEIMLLESSGSARFACVGVCDYRFDADLKVGRWFLELDG